MRTNDSLMLQLTLVTIKFVVTSVKCSINESSVRTTITLHLKLVNEALFSGNQNIETKMSVPYTLTVWSSLQLLFVISTPIIISLNLNSLTFPSLSYFEQRFILFPVLRPRANSHQVRFQPSSCDSLHFAAARLRQMSAILSSPACACTRHDSDACNTPR